MAKKHKKGRLQQFVEESGLQVDEVNARGFMQANIKCSLHYILRITPICIVYTCNSIC